MKFLSRFSTYYTFEEISTRLDTYTFQIYKTYVNEKVVNEISETFV